MCIIIVKEKGKIVPNETIKKSATINPDGLGVVWLDDYSITYHKSKEHKVLQTDRPYIAHFRYATIGKVNIENTHPFKCGSNSDEYLMMNGTISGLGNKDTCDSKVLAEMIGWMPRKEWKNQLAMFSSRFVCANPKTKRYEIFNQELWTQHDGVWYSKDNVLEPHYVAVYGTLKKGHSNYHHYLSKSTFVGKGVTADKYPLVVQSLPYLLDEKGKGHNVEVDVFRVSDSMFKDLDRLEGHPNFYTRKQITISMANNTKVTCWVYFNTKMKSTPVDKLLKTYKQEPYKPTYGTYLSPTTKQTSGVVNQTWEGKYDSIKDEAPLCPVCYDYVTNDMFGSHYCKRCDGWYDEKELLTL
jgi:gamma-glutamylaminecyclotransferase